MNEAVRPVGSDARPASAGAWALRSPPLRPSADPVAKRACGGRAYRFGLQAEAQACAALERDGWTVLGRRLRTAAGEVDAVAERDGVLAIIEIKARPRLAEAAAALSARQRTRLLAAGETILAEHPAWGRRGVRFDVMLVDAGGAVRRIADAFRLE